VAGLDSQRYVLAECDLEALDGAIFVAARVGADRFAAHAAVDDDRDAARNFKEAEEEVLARIAGGLFLSCVATMNVGAPVLRAVCALTVWA
jgi:hypothetical protein